MEAIKEIHEQFSELTRQSGELQNRLKGTPVSNKLHESLQNLNARCKDYSKAASAGDVQAILDKAKAAAIFGIVTSQNLAQVQGVNEETKALGESLGQVAAALRSKVEDDPSTYRPLGEVPSIPPPRLPEFATTALSRLEQIVVDQEKQDERIKNRLADNDRRLAAFAESLSKVEEETRETTAKVA